MRNPLCLLMLLLLIPVVGCRGCTQAKPEKELTEKEKREAEKKKERILASGLKTVPFGDNDNKDEIDSNLVKPGHWYQANVKFKANLGDESLTASVSMRGKGGTKGSFAAGQAPLEFNRNFSLAKGQEKNVRMHFFQPEMPSTEDKNDPSLSIVPADIEILQRSVGTRIYNSGTANKLISGYQYYMVTLSRDPSRYLFWRGLDCIVWPSMTRFSDERIAPYRVIDLNEDQIASQFPDKLYAMTSMSHLVINDTSISLMSPEQQEALRDWLYFGGTIILNGPDCITGLDSSFLKEFTPVITSGSDVLSSSDIEVLNRDWTIRQVGEARKTPLSPDRPIPKLIGKLAAGSSWVLYANGGQTKSMEGLIAERLVGQGRVVMTTFSMADYGLVKWPSYGSLIHNAVLGKPNRQITKGNEPDTLFAGANENSEFNPIHSTRLRLWARDLDSTTAAKKKDDKKSKIERPNRGEFMEQDAKFFDRRVESLKRTSLGSWNPEALVLKNAKNSLQESSGITVPKINTILKLLIGYLIVLVPLNWFVFRLIGRVELAWLAAPLIALVGAFAVARSVQLDVGFTRSETTVGFLEVHSGYPRGVLSRYTALYTSLSTNYSATFPKESGVVLPMPASLGETIRRPRGIVSTLEYWYADDRGSGLRNLSVLSNTTGLLHSEEVTELGQGLYGQVTGEVGQGDLANNSEIVIRDIGIVGRRPDGQIVSGWLGDIGPKEKKSTKLESRNDKEGWLAEWDAKPPLRKPNFLRSDNSLWTESELGDELYLGPILFELVKSYPLQIGETIAIGWTDSSIGSLEISPSAKQKKERTVVLAHLSPGTLPVIQPDEAIFPRKTNSESGNSN